MFPKLNYLRIRGDGGRGGAYSTQWQHFQIFDFFLIFYMTFSIDISKFWFFQKSRKNLKHFEFKIVWGIVLHDKNGFSSEFSTSGVSVLLVCGNNVPDTLRLFLWSRYGSNKHWSPLPFGYYFNNHNNIFIYYLINLTTKCSPAALISQSKIHC